MSKSAMQRSVKPAVECLEGRWVPAVVSVGAGQAVKTLAEAATVAQSGDTVRIDAGTYTGAGIIATWNQSNIVIEGVGDVKLDATGLNIPNRKGVFVVNGTNTTIRNIDFVGAHDSIGADKNWAGIRMQGTNLIVTQCGFFNNDNGILAGANTSSDILVEYSEFGSNGYGDGQSHNMYIGNQRSFTLQYSYTHDAVVGHTVKSRANTNTIQYNWIGNTGTGSTSYEINLPNGGTTYIIGNVIRQDANSQNGTIIDWGSEGASNPSQGVFVVNNTIINDRSAGTYVRLMNTTPGPVQVLNNIFAGAGAAGTTVYSGQTATQAGNLVGVNPGFVNAAARDYRLTSGSAAVNAGVNPGSANGVSLTPTRQYVATANSQARPVSGALDVGAYEVATAPSNAAPTVQTGARASANPVAGTSVGLSVLGADDAGEAGLTYTWATTGTPPAAVAFSANGTNAAKNATATFTRAGIYNFQVTIRDAGGLTVTSNVSVTVSQTLTSIAVTPATWSLASGQTQQFNATARDQFGVALSTQPAFAWSLASGIGSISATGLYTAPAGTGSATVRVTSGSVSATAAITVVAPTNTPPTVQTAARASASPVAGTNVGLSVLGADSAGEGTLTYSWATTGTPPAGVSFSANGTNAAKNTTATFTRAGVYNFQVTITDAGGLSVTSSVAVTVNQTLTSIAVTPASVSLVNGGTQQFAATARDQFGVALSSQPAFTWAMASGGGSVSSTGLFTAPASGTGGASVRVTSGAVSATAAITVVAPTNTPPTVQTAARASASPVTGTTVGLSVLGADSTGEGTLTYSWATTGTPPAGVSFSANGTNAAKNATATFTRAGVYSFQVTIRDAGGLTVTSNVSVTVNQTLTSIAVTPGSVSLSNGGTQQFAATARDQFGAALSTHPALAWSLVSGVGGISSTGLYTAPATGSGSASVRVASGAVSATAAVTVVAAPVGQGTGLSATYFDNIDFTGTTLTRTDATVNFNWGSGSPAASIGADTFSARWTGQVQARYTETYTFYTSTDDGVRLYVNNQLVINNWTNHSPTVNSGTITLTAGQRYDIRLEYFENGGGAVMKLEWQSARQAREVIPQSQLFLPAAAVPSAGLTATYFDNRDFTGASVTRQDASVNFDWGAGSPAAGIAADTFSARWTGQITARYTETHTFLTTSDDGIRLWINGQLVIDQWNDHSPTTHSGTIALTAGQPVDIRLEYYENGGGAVAKLEWQSARQVREIVPASQLSSYSSFDQLALKTRLV